MMRKCRIEVSASNMNDSDTLPLAKTRTTAITKSAHRAIPQRIARVATIGITYVQKAVDMGWGRDIRIESASREYLYGVPAQRVAFLPPREVRHRPPRRQGETIAAAPGPCHGLFSGRFLPWTLFGAYLTVFT